MALSPQRATSHEARVDRRRVRPMACPDLVRLGLPRDGGYVVPAGQVAGTDTLLSFGMKDDWSFEADFERRRPGVRIVGVDPTVGPALFLRRILSSARVLMSPSPDGGAKGRKRHRASLANALHYFWFFHARHRHVRRWVAATPGPDCITLDDLLARAPSVRPHSVFLKMDIEGAEYGIVPAIVAAHDRFNVVVVEFHRVGKRAAEFNVAIASLSERFHVVHVHGNNYASYDERSGFPNAVEITFVHQALLSGPPVPSPYAYPRDRLDQPNQPRRPDYALRFD